VSTAALGTMAAMWLHPRKQKGIAISCRAVANTGAGFILCPRANIRVVPLSKFERVENIGELSVRMFSDAWP
jgi:hypothetical protein